MALSTRPAAAGDSRARRLCDSGALEQVYYENMPESSRLFGRRLCSISYMERDTRMRTLAFSSTQLVNPHNDKQSSSFVYACFIRIPSLSFITLA